jgi:hypothetical protein
MRSLKKKCHPAQQKNATLQNSTMACSILLARLHPAKFVADIGSHRRYAEFNCGDNGTI